MLLESQPIATVGNTTETAGGGISLGVTGCSGYVSTQFREVYGLR